MTWKGESRLVTRRWALASARRSFTSTSIGEERWETEARVLRGETDAMRLGSGILTAAIQLTEERCGASGGRSGDSGYRSVASASFFEFFFVFDLDFDFCWLSSQHLLTWKPLFPHTPSSRPFKLSAPYS